MHENYGRDLDLNLLRVFAVVGECKTVTEAATRLYLTQPAVSSALRRLAVAIGAPLFVRQGRGLVLTKRGEELRAEVQTHLRALVDAALVARAFDPKTSGRTVRLALSDASEVWLLPRLLQVLEREAPFIRLVALPVQFRTVGAALTTGAAEIAVTVADELPVEIRRQTLLWGDFVCVYDPRRVKVKRNLSEAQYFTHEHVIVSYNGDLRGIVEDMLQKQRKVRCSVSSFANIGAVVDGSTLLATVPRLVADQMLVTRPHLRHAMLPFALRGTPVELLWSKRTDDDHACRFLREHIAQLAKQKATKRKP